MPAGTITLTNNSATVTGSGTSFTSELKPNDFIVAVVGGVTYTLGVQSVNSATSVTLITAYGGPTTSALAWTPVPNAALVGITAQVAADVAKAIRGLNLDKANWQQVFSASGNITVTLPDGSAYSGPSWGGITSSLNNKANTADVLTKSDNLSSLTDKAAARTNLGLGDSATRNIGTSPTSVASGDDSRLGTLNNKTGGIVSSVITQYSTSSQGVIQALSSYRPNSSAGQTNTFGRMTVGQGTNAASSNAVNFNFVELVGSYFYLDLGVYAGGIGYGWHFRQGGNAYATSGSWINSSDSRLKGDQKVICPDEDILDNEDFLAIRGLTWNRLDGENSPGVGLLAQAVGKLIPQAVTTDAGVKKKLSDGTTIKDPLFLDTAGAAAAMQQEAILSLTKRLKALEQDNKQKDDALSEIFARMKAIDGLDA
ncbi:hypothetical protein [Pantoea septica]|uniref:hypothetical protein n=1 Tax=Pantoea septica TaxID=472695 RepID=UPI0028D2F6F6|nr:hypothetical protein [Pantoea septica]